MFGLNLGLLIILFSIIPTALAKIPRLALFYTFNLIVITANMFLSVIVIQIFHKTGGSVPRIIQKIFIKVLAKVFCLHTTKRSSHNSNESHELRPLLIKEKSFNLTNESSSKSVTSESLNDRLVSIDKDIKEILNSVYYTKKRLEEKEERQYQIASWKVVALVLDRIFFISYLIELLIFFFIY